MGKKEKEALVIPHPLYFLWAFVAAKQTSSVFL